MTVRDMLDRTWYLAGPMSGIEEQNYPAFADACDYLRKLGLKIVSPHETLEHPHEPTEERWRELLRHDMGTLLMCGGIILLPGWTASRGAKAELQTALTLGLPVLMLVTDVGLVDIS